MNVQLLPAALEEIAVLRASGYRGAGFLLGAEIGRYTLVERLLPLAFDARGSGAAYAAACEKFGERLLGVFFCRLRPLARDWFIGDLVLAVGPRQLRPLICVPAAAGPRARLSPLLENEEG
ncbi:MAG: hypothetical protein MUC72_10030 [Acidobacteria bacterium]|jgi:hypothetical protein|nr:hypothetical protein [Acidobacteriota bacterium]